jgi:hypothetical protein
MEEKDEQKEQKGEAMRPARIRIHLPGFAIEDEVRFGDLVKRATYAIGIKQPCSGCEHRAEALNRWISFY